MPLVIAIDGPAGAGKSTVAQKVAARHVLTVNENAELESTLPWVDSNSAFSLTVRT